MRIQDVGQQLTTPLDAPAFPPGPYRFTDREYLTITYRTTLSSLEDVDMITPKELVGLLPLPLSRTTSTAPWCRSFLAAKSQRNGRRSP
jgi:acetoacetate decarboxylase